MSRKKELFEPAELARDEWWAAVCRWSRSCSGVSLKEMVKMINAELKTAWKISHPSTGLSINMRVDVVTSECDEDGRSYDRYPPHVYTLETAVIELKARV